MLIADDDPMLRLIMAHKLGAAGYQVECVEDGQAALEAADRLRPDILLLDVMMPIMDGFEVLKRLKSAPHGGRVSVIMVTALDRDQDLASAQELGAADYLVKPVNLDELVSRMSKLKIKQLSPA